MAKITKRIHMIFKEINIAKSYNIDDAISIIKKQATAKFIESVDVAINLGINARKAEQNVRGTVTLPYGTGRSIRIAVFTYQENVQIAKAYGADFAGMEDLADQIKKKKIFFDVVICSPETLYLVEQLKDILAPHGLMPNYKAGTITSDITTAIKNAKAGKISYRNDKNGIIHATIGKVNFDDNKLKENLEALLYELKKNKPTQVKGIYFKKISISTTMGIGITINQIT